MTEYQGTKEHKNQIRVNELFQTLSASEKRYIALWLERSDVQLGRLLQLIKQAEKKKQGSVSITKKQDQQFAYLYQSMLKAMRNYHDQESIDSQLRSMQANVEFLLSKRLYDQSLKELDKLIGKAKLFNRYPMLIAALVLQQNIYLERESKKFSETFYRNVEALENAILRLQNSLQLERIKNELLLQLRSSFQQQDADKPLLISKLQKQLENTKEMHDFISNHHRLHGLAIGSICAGNWSDALSHYEILIMHWKNNPLWITEDSLTYKKILSNYLNACHATGNFSQINTLIREITEIPCRNLEEEAEQFQNVYFLKLLLLLNTNKFHNLDDLVTEISKGINRYKSKINKARELMFYYNISIAYFLLTEWKKAQHYLNMIINTRHSEHRQDIQNLARIFRLIVYLELGQNEMLEYEIINVERYLRQRKALGSYEVQIIKLIKKLTSADKNEMVIIFKKFTPAFESSATVNPGQYEIGLWAKFRLNGNKMIE